MSEQKAQPEHNIPVWGVFLLFLGTVFLLQTLNILPWSLWGTLWRFWPVLIIAIGLGILLRHYNPWLISTLILVLFFACLGIAIWQYGPYSLLGETTKSYSVPLDNLRSARIEIDFTAGSLTVGSLPRNSSNLVEVASDTGHEEKNIRANFVTQNGEGSLNLTTERVNRQFWNETIWKVEFTRKIPLIMDIKSEVGNLDLDLSNLEVGELQMHINASNCLVTMPSSAGHTDVSIQADVINLEITVPEGVSARIKVDADLASLYVDKNRFPRKGDFYISDGFESSANRIDIELNCNVGRVAVK